MKWQLKTEQRSKRLFEKSQKTWPGETSVLTVELGRGVFWWGLNQHTQKGRDEKSAGSSRGTGKPAALRRNLIPKEGQYRLTWKRQAELVTFRRGVRCLDVSPLLLSLERQAAFTCRQKDLCSQWVWSVEGVDTKLSYGSIDSIPDK